MLTITYKGVYMSAASLNTFTKNLPPEKMALFNALYYSEEKSTSIAYVFLIFLGSIGGQKFYLNNSKKWLYLLFSWTMIPSLIAIFELFIMAKIVSKYNQILANEIITLIKNYDDEATIRQVFKSTRKNTKVGIAICIAIAVIASLIAAINKKSPSTISSLEQEVDQPDVKAKTVTKPIEISASELYNEYKQNEARADSKYNNKQLYIIGHISEIHKVTSSLTTVALGVGDEFGLGGIECDLNSDNKNLQSIATGDEITLIGKVNGSGLTGEAVQLSDGCSILK